MKERSFARRPSFLRREGGLRPPRQGAAPGGLSTRAWRSTSFVEADRATPVGRGSRSTDLDRPRPTSTSTSTVEVGRGKLTPLAALASISDHPL